MNTGYLHSPITPRDWIFKQYSPLGVGQNQGVPNWKHLLPMIEYQNNHGFDRWACVSYAVLNWLEVEYKKQTGIEANFSDRWLASLSGTKIGVGNYFTTVFDTLREKGIVWEERWGDVKTPEEYYSKIPQEIINEGMDFLMKWSLYREWVNPYRKEDILQALSDTPLIVSVAYEGGSGVLNPTGVHNHAVLLYGIDDDDNYLIFDHYPVNTFKTYHKDYIFGGIMKGTLIRKNNIMFTPKDNELYSLEEGREQKLAMGLNGDLIVYDEKIDTVLNAVKRSKQWQVPISLTMAKWNCVDKRNGKREIIENKKI
jgi:hypothetical protein